MKRILFLVVILLATVGAGAQVLRAFTPRYNNPSVRGNIVFVSNSITKADTLVNPYEFPPAGTSVNNSKLGINADIDNETVVLPWNTPWKYSDSGYAPGTTTWRNVVYPDGGWLTATPGIPYLTNTRDIGYGDGDEVSPYMYAGNSGGCGPRPAIQFPTCGSKYWTTYFRRVINIPSIAAYVGFRINLHRDDGAVIYVNGTEVARSNMPTGGIVYSTPASADVEGSNEYEVINIGTAAFVNGNNTIAVEIHQRTQTSADISFRMEMLGIAASNGTFNSSSADLNLPSCTQVLWAGLYWGATQGVDGTNVAWRVGENNVKIRVPGAPGYTTVTSTQTDYHDNILSPGLPHTGYRCFVDITAMINATNPNGTYTIADVVSPAGIINIAGGWTIVIAYADPTTIVRNLTVFDGSAIMNGGDPAMFIPITGFLTPPSGPVSCELGAVVYDGDRISVDSFKFKQNSNPLIGSYTDLTPTAVNPTSNTGDIWNSTISAYGVNVVTRNPAYLNTAGYDADIMNVPNVGNAVLGNSQTSASIKVMSPSENYFIQVATTSISQYTPTFAFDKTATDINGGSLIPGDSIRYLISYTNAGNDSSINSMIIDNLPTGATFIPGSIRIGGVARTDVAGDDQAEYSLVNNRITFRVGVGANAVSGGRIGPGVSSNVQFDVIVSSSCAILSCVGSLRNSARINYTGKTSGAVLYDSSGVNNAGCITLGPVINPVAGACFLPKDTVMVNQCNNLTVLLPWRKYAGYTFYNAQPFIPGNIYDHTVPVTTSGIYWAYFDNGAGCSDTARIVVIITTCPDIDDDNDGIPDYVEFNSALALADHNTNGIPNWKDPLYPGYIDNNSDGVNDNFDHGADADNDGIPNFYDTGFAGFVDSDSDGVNDNSDRDLDGIPNQFDLDSDNDGIPDVVESYGVDTNGNGVIDNYTDTDNDGFSQNVDGNNTGVQGSGNGLTAIDFDGDGIGNYLDTDSDNDGIPDVVEVAGPYSTNNGQLATLTDLNGDGLSDSYINGTALLITGPDVGPVNGRADNWPNKNLDRDLRPNAYDVDSDGDGIVDVIEAGLPDANVNGIVDGVLGTDGWSTSVSGLVSLNLRNTDTDGKYDFLDIDSDDDGIPDNIEGMSTLGYALPTLVDADGDGLMNPYDNLPAGFSGSGILLYDHDADGTPDYRDLDTDSDGQPDIIEGNDFNLNNIADDNVSLTGLDTDLDGLDNRFDSLNNVTNIKGTSYRMGNGGTFTGDPVPGSRCTVQKRFPANADRDWRFVGAVLPIQILKFTGVLQNSNTLLNWTIITPKEIARFEIERSLDNNNYAKVGTVNDAVQLNTEQSFAYTDNIAGISNEFIYYRLKVIGKMGEIKYSNVLVIRRSNTKLPVTIMPNPAKEYVSIRFYSEKEMDVTLRLIDNIGKVVLLQKHHVLKGNNTLQLNELTKYSNGVYSLQVLINEELITQKLILAN